MLFAAGAISFASACADEPAIDAPAIDPPPTRGEEQLREELRKLSHEVSVDDVVEALGRNKKLTDAARQQLIEQHAKLAGLPFRWGGECRCDRREAQALGQLSLQIRQMRAVLEGPLAGLGDGAEAQRQRDTAVADGLDKQPWRAAAAIPALEQMLQADGLPVRRALVEMLRGIGSADASQALARRALYDFSPEVRAAAVEVLKTRPRDHYEATLLAGFRHPWPQVAWNAAEAVVALPSRQLAGALERLRDLPDPAAPAADESGNWSVREVAAVNHFRNCLLCHASATTPRDPVRGPIPVPGQPLPTYLQATGDFVRADVTYLRQDFSALQAVEEPGAWPKVQRFDYLLRSRPLTPEEAAAIAPAATSYPQRDAVLYALRRLAK
jgi:hypothetical protein